jgi:RNA polymerase sigma-70 factor (ECF subfamily)
MSGSVSEETHPELSVSTPDVRAIYADALQRAMLHAAAHVDRDQAREIAHQVAAALVRRLTGPGGEAGLAPGHAANDPVEVMDAFVHRAVVNRVRDLWRSSRRRQAAEDLFHGERSALAPAWSRPDSDLESEELVRIVEDAIAAMPDGMRRVFLLIRRDERSYKDVAATLGIGVGTVHTQLSRASAVLRNAVANYRDETPAPSRTERRPRGVK